MRASRTSGSVEGVLRNGHPYSDSLNGPSDKPGTIQQLLVESLLLSVVAAALGVWLSRFGVQFVAGAFGRNIPY
jgi:hypothetical protein